MRILIITTSHGFSTNAIIAAAKQQGHKVLVKAPTEITLPMAHMPDRILFCSTKHAPRTAVALVAEYAKQNNIRCIEAPEHYLRPLSKMISIITRTSSPWLLANTPQTCCIFSVDQLSRGDALRWPRIIKPDVGSNRRGVWKAKTPTGLKNKAIEHFERADGTPFVFQEFIHAAREYRVLMLKDEVLAIVHKKTFVPIEQLDMPDAQRRQDVRILTKAARQLMRLHNLTFSGMDFLFAKHPKDKLYVIECNRNPAFKATQANTQMNIANKVVSCLTESN